MKIWIHKGKSLSEALIFTPTNQNYVDRLFMYWTRNSMSNHLSYCGLASWCKNKCFWNRFTCTYVFLPQHNYAISIYFEWVTIKWQTLYVQLKKGKRRPQYETNPLLISTGFLKYPVSLDNFSISKLSVWEYENSFSVLTWFL